MKWNENRYWGILMLLLSCCLASCKKDTPVTNYQVQETDAAAIIADNILPRYGGLLLQIDNAFSLNIQSGLRCGVLKDSTLTGSNTVGAAILFDYHLLWRYNYDCSSLIQYFDFSGQNNYEGYNYISAEQRNGSFILTPKTMQPGMYECSFDWKSSGKQRIKALGSSAFNSTIELNAVNLTLDQASMKIVSGKFMVKMYGTAAGSFSFSGELTFSGKNKATLILNSGRIYPLSW